MNPDKDEVIKAKQDVYESCECDNRTQLVAVKGRSYTIMFKGYSGSHFRNEQGTLSKYNPKFYETTKS